MFYQDQFDHTRFIEIIPNADYVDRVNNKTYHKVRVFYNEHGSMRFVGKSEVVSTLIENARIGFVSTGK